MNEVAEAIRRTRRTLAEKTWVPRNPGEGETCLAMAYVKTAGTGPLGELVWEALKRQVSAITLVAWNDRQTDVGAVLGMTLQALITELCKPTLARRTTEA